MNINHYQKQAQYYSNLSILKRLKATIHLEDKEDQLFWDSLFKLYFPNEKFNFIAYSKSPSGNNTTGCTQCLAYKKYLNKNFLICIDSDYRYLLQDPDIDINHFIFQTYTYSFENHLCANNRLSTTCSDCCNIPNTVFDFNLFLKQYSKIIYELFIWHFALNKSGLFPICDFMSIITENEIETDNQASSFLAIIDKKARTKIEELKKIYPTFDFEKERYSLNQLGITEENTYLYIRGHNLFDLCLKIGNKVIHNYFKGEELKLNADKKAIASLYAQRKTFKKEIKKNIQLSSYPEINRIEQDMKAYTTL